MAQQIEDQINTIERALGERMVRHALIILRSWLIELGENNPYEARFADINERYQSVFANFLTSDAADREEQLDILTGETYRLVDDVYASIRLRRGLSPEMHGFNGQNPQSIMHYWSHCVHFTEEDLIWFIDIVNDSNRSALALMAVSSLSKNLRECFSEPAILALIEGISSTNTVVAEQCLANVMLLLAHYDVRVDFFPDIQNNFVEAIGEGDSAFEVLCAMIRSTKMSLRDMLAKNELSYDDLPQELRDLLSMTNSEGDINGIASWVPGSEQEYLSGLIQILPDTWLYSVLIGDDARRLQAIQMMYLSIGKMDLMWDNLDAAERFLVHQLRGDKATAMDYINYGHCLMMRGDRMMAYESYRQAREMCKSSKEFFNLFRPDRRQLVDHGVPIEYVYLIEDQLLSV